MKNISIISSDLDGAELRRKQHGYFARCNGTADDRVINQAISDLELKLFSIKAEDWERIFGGVR